MLSYWWITNKEKIVIATLAAKVDTNSRQFWCRGIYLGIVNPNWRMFMLAIIQDDMSRHKTDGSSTELREDAGLRPQLGAATGKWDIANRNE